MARNLWLWVVLVLVALGVGFFGGRISSGYNGSTVEAKIKELSGNLAALSSKVDELKQRVAQSDIAEIEELKATIERLSRSTGFGALKIAFVRSPEEVMLSYKGTEESLRKFRKEREKKEKEISSLQEQVKAGTLAPVEAQRRVNQLEMELAALDQQLTNEIADKILVAVNEIGREKAYDLILKRKDVVLFYKEGLLEDTTAYVATVMNLRWLLELKGLRVAEEIPGTSVQLTREALNRVILAMAKALMSYVQEDMDLDAIKLKPVIMAPIEQDTQLPKELSEFLRKEFLRKSVDDDKLMEIARITKDLLRKV